MIKVAGDADHVVLDTPRRASSRGRPRLRVVLGVMVAVLVANAATIGLSILAPEVGSGVAALIAVFSLAAMLGPYIASVVLHRRNSDDSKVTLTPHLLKVEGGSGIEIPLEEVRTIEIIHVRDRGHLRFHTNEGSVDLLDGLFTHELEWVHRVVQHITQQTRAELVAAGQDVDQVARAPAALEALRQER